MPRNTRLVTEATKLLSETLKEHFITAIGEALENEQVTEVLHALGIISEEECGEILAEGIFDALNQSFDEVFSLGQGDEDSEDCADDEDTDPVY
jgi:hypothetical protein